VAVRRVDWKAAADGAWLAVAITLPPTIVVRLFKDGDLEGQESYLWVVPVLALLVGFAVGGHRAATRRPDAPLLHAAASAACAFAALAALAVVRRFVDGDGLTVPLVVTLMLLLQITVSLAVIGGYVAMRREAAAAAGGGPAPARPDDRVPPDPEP
jgi:peptidoglycan/LPS O-acetylase OafA/YrhL